MAGTCSQNLVIRSIYIIRGSKGNQRQGHVAKSPGELKSTSYQGAPDSPHLRSRVIMMLKLMSKIMSKIMRKITRIIKRKIITKTYEQNYEDSR